MVLELVLSLTSFELLDLLALSGNEAIEGITNAIELGSPSSFMLSQRCTMGSHHNSKDVGLLCSSLAGLLDLVK